MLKTADYKRSLFFTVVLAVIVNALLVLYVVKQTESISQMEDLMYNKSPQEFAVNQKLTEIERQLGYLGFIHHFKNYVIRRDIQYFHEASGKYQLLTFQLNELEELVDSSSIQEEIEVLRSTLDEYFHKLMLAKEEYTSLSVEELDRIVKVDDAAAGQALLAIQRSLIPKREEIISSSRTQLEHMHQYMWEFNFFLLPTILVTTLFIIATLKRSTYLSQELEQIVDISPDAILYLNKGGEILRANKRASVLFGYTQSEFSRLVIEDLVTSPLRSKHSEYQQLFHQKEPSNEMGNKFRPIQGVSKDGQTLELTIAITSALIVDKPRTVCVIKDMQAHNYLKQEAEQDHLTHLYNRRAIDHLLFRELCRSKKISTDLSILLIDLDNFKNINDEFGHAFGDKTLVKVASFLRANTRNYDILGRWGGDEFILICPNLRESHSVAYAERLLDGFQKTTIAHGGLGLSIGIATNSKHQQYDEKSIFDAADKALYTSKKRGKSQATHINDVGKHDVRRNA
ncbi:GGDEF domain-containing protein [Vibrio japonicus]|uniref:diguanylate cyclase n=1 Tax=Vibrio japonicus TaxID=1824638 RepID=A0ABY5LME5_9VIBR|nr:diguanylate cyclase [Vibrio japonicus]UUM30950.1 diguanylate cyclase [Vibrio japonicus]